MELTREQIYEQENQKLADYFMEEYFYKIFRLPKPQDTTERIKYPRYLELIISPKCNLGCNYCYIHHHKKDIFNECLFNAEDTLKNVQLVMDWLDKNNYVMPLEIFSGELFAQEIGFQVLDIIYNSQVKLPCEKRIPYITIPTNYTFICSDELTQRILDIYNNFKEIGIRICFSASFDGKFMEQNRPYIKDLDIPIQVVRDDEYYDKAFTFIKKVNGGLHPMVYSKDISLWKDNFMWFQEMMAKYDIDWRHIYLLQVRNEEWTMDEIKALQEFIEFLYEFAWNKCEQDSDKMVEFLLHEMGFNLLAEPYNRCDRGLTCAIQSTLHVRASDLKVYPCHRLGYESFYCGELIPDEDSVLKYKNNNIELLNLICGVNKKYLPHCTSCIVRDNCIGPCLGANYESNKNMFVTPPTVCLVMHAIVTTSVKMMNKYNLFDQLSKFIDEQMMAGLKLVEKELSND